MHTHAKKKIRSYVSLLINVVRCFRNEILFSEYVNVNILAAANPNKLMS